LVTLLGFAFVLSCSSEMGVERANVLGIGVSVIDQDSAREFLFDAARDGRRGYVTITNVHSVSEAHGDPEFRRIFNRALLCTPDGMPLVWMGRLQGFHSIRRVYGPDLMLNLFQHSRDGQFTHFLYGGKPGVADELAHVLGKRFPGAQIAGTYSPPYRALNPDELHALEKRIAETKPDFVWVGIGMPKQERFMAEHAAALTGATIFIGVGAAFDFLTGRVRQAPKWMQSAGLEWFFRLTQEPRRLWKRYLLNNPLFIMRAAAQLLGLRRYPLESASPVPTAGRSVAE
jgi:N-acetylglucosaminyldiphosphoundecaprenol N-acetyl-beta-D-mannosaminyltransferase